MLSLANYQVFENKYERKCIVKWIKWRDSNVLGPDAGYKTRTIIKINWNEILIIKY